MGTDGIVAERLARKIADSSGGVAIVTPAIYGGFSPHHMEFPGTLTLKVSTLSAILLDYVESFQAHGIDRFMIVNGHGGNIAFLPAWMAEVQDSHGVRIALAHWSLLGRDIVAEIATSNVFGHACEVETSLVMSLAPELLVADPPSAVGLIPPGHPLVRGQVIPEREIGVFVPRKFSAITPNGALGDPSAANVQLGNELVDAVVDRASAVVRWLAES
jgi:creatinine amidohydrolase